MSAWLLACREPIAHTARAAPRFAVTAFMAKRPAVEPGRVLRDRAVKTANGGMRCDDARVLAIPGEATGSFAAGARTPWRASDSSRTRWSGPQQFFAVDLRQDQAIRVTLDDHGNFDAGLYVLHHCGEALPANVDRRVNSPAPVLTFAGPEAGRYYIVIDAWLGDRGGAYTLKVTSVER